MASGRQRSSALCLSTRGRQDGYVCRVAVTRVTLSAPSLGNNNNQEVNNNVPASNVGIAVNATYGLTISWIMHDRLHYKLVCNYSITILLLWNSSTK
jgi:hypothetical protein